MESYVYQKKIHRIDIPDLEQGVFVVCAICTKLFSSAPSFDDVQCLVKELLEGREVVGHDVEKDISVAHSGPSST